MRRRKATGEWGKRSRVARPKLESRRRARSGGSGKSAFVASCIIHKSGLFLYCKVYRRVALQVLDRLYFRTRIPQRSLPVAQVFGRHLQNLKFFHHPNEKI